MHTNCSMKCRSLNPFRSLHNTKISPMFTLSLFRPKSSSKCTKQFAFSPSLFSLLSHSFHSSSFSTPSSSLVEKICFDVVQAFHETIDSRPAHQKLNLDINPDTLCNDKVITIIASLAEDAGSNVALRFFHWAIELPKFRHFMRLYIVCANCLISNQNFDAAHEVLMCMVRNFVEIGRFKEAVSMVIEMHNQGLSPSTYTLNCILRIACQMGLVDYGEYVFMELCRKGVRPGQPSFVSMVVSYCRNGRISEMDKWLSRTINRKFVLDNAACTLVMSTFIKAGDVSKAFWFFNKMRELGFKPNLINYTCLINGLCKKGNVKQAFELLEEMVTKEGWKPNVFTHTIMIDGLCRKGWTEKAFRLFLKLVRSDDYKPNECTYTAMINGYCKEGKLSRAEMLFGKMKEQELVPNVDTYTTLVDGHCKQGNFERAYELMEIMAEEGVVPNMFTYNAIMSGLCKKGRLQEAYELFSDTIRRGLKADKVTYTILMSASSKYSNAQVALAWLGRMTKEGFGADMYTYNILISSFCRQKNMVESELWYKEAIKVGLVPTKETYTSLVSGYCGIGNVDTAIDYFQKMSDHGCSPDSFTYGALIGGLCKEKKLEEAQKLYNFMINRGLFPCEVSRVTLCYEYCNVDDHGSASDILEGLDKKLWSRTVNTLIRKLCCDGKVDMAALFFGKLLDKQPIVGRVTLAAFKAACYEQNKYELYSTFSDRCLLSETSKEAK